MIVILHVIIACSSVAFVTFSFAHPTAKKLFTNYVLVVLTLISGVYMTVSSPSYMVRSCIAGIVYISLVSLAIVAMRAKFLRLQQNTQ